MEPLKSIKYFKFCRILVAPFRKKNQRYWIAVKNAVDKLLLFG